MKWPDWKEWSSSELALLFSTAILGLLLRVVFPDLVGLASDEIASLFYAENPGLIFRTETHPPLYYLFLIPFSWLDPYLIRVGMGLLSFSLIVYALILSRGVLSKTGTCVLAALLFLSPADIFFSRTIRQYSLLLELSTILILLNEKSARKLAKIFLSVLLSGIHPLGWLPPFSLGIRNYLKDKKLTPGSLIYIFSCVPIFLYYGLKLALGGREGVIGSFAVNGKKYASFPLDILNTFSGEHFPRINFIPIPELSKFITAGLILCTIASALYLKFVRKTPLKFFYDFFLMMSFSLLFVEVFTAAFVNIENARYLIFLLAPLYLLAAEVLGHYQWSAICILGPLMLNLILIEPLLGYSFERETFGYYAEIKKQEPDVELALCGNIYHFWYYQHRDQTLCHDEIEKYKSSGKDLVLVDLNGAGTKYLFDHKEEIQVLDYRFHGYTRGYHLRFRTPSEKRP